MTLNIVVWACAVIHKRTNDSASMRVELWSCLVGTAGRFGTAYISLFFRAVMTYLDRSHKNKKGDKDV
jgi:hypothetical protein